MSRRHLVMLVALAAIWGASFMFIKVAVRELAPGVVVFGRVLIGAVALVPAIPLLGGWRRLVGELRRHALALLALGVFNAALPFWLLAWSEERLDSGLSAVLQASTPLFTALLALGFSRRDRVRGTALVGVLIGFVGVALLVGAQHRGDIVSALAVLGTAFCYAAAALYAGVRLKDTPPVVTSFGTLAAASVLTLPLGVAQLPAELPGWKAIGSVVALGAVGLGVAYLLYFGLIAGAGVQSAVLVTYLVPALALAYGSSFLNEPLTGTALGGLALILAGVALGTGTLRLGRLHSASVTNVLHEHVERFNAGVRSGNWAPMVDAFASDAEMEFRGVPVGPFIGREAIAAAYRDQPPDDELRILEERARNGRVDARYAWLAEPDMAAGELLLEHAGGEIRKLVVTFERGVSWS